MLSCSVQSPARVIPGMAGALWITGSWEDSADCQLSFSLRFLFSRVTLCQIITWSKSALLHLNIKLIFYIRCRRLDICDYFLLIFRFFFFFCFQSKSRFSANFKIGIVCTSVVYSRAVEDLACGVGSWEVFLFLFMAGEQEKSSLSISFHLC